MKNPFKRDDEYEQARKELEGELEKGTFLAKQLIIHLKSMDADRGKLPIVVGDTKYEVTVERIP